MKILCLSDLHLTDHCLLNPENKRIMEVSELHPDADLVIITGDIFESRIYFDPYKQLAAMFKSRPVVCTLGNHEFFHRSIKQTLDKYQEQYNPKKYDVHYLDIIGRYEIGNIRLVGNVLWYDGSLKSRPIQNLYDWGNGNWMDKTIKSFDYEKEHLECINQIIDNAIIDDKINVLMTHTVPFRKANSHPETSVLNAFSGIDNITTKIGKGKVKYAICGHTHLRAFGTFHGVDTINVGSDYYPNDLKWHILEI